MHRAPAVSYPVGRSFFHGGMVLAVGLVGSLLVLLWTASPVVLGWRQWGLAGILVATVLGAGESWRRTPQGVLRWDGQFWEWATPGRLLGGHLAVHLDFQSWMLLSMQTGRNGKVWLWPERKSDPLCWDALRRAAFAQVGADHPQAASSDPRRSQGKA